MRANHHESVGRKATILKPGVTGNGSRAAGQKQCLFRGRRSAEAMRSIKERLVMHCYSGKTVYGGIDHRPRVSR